MKKNKTNLNWRTAIVMAIIGLATLCHSSRLSAQYIHTNGTQIVDGSGNDIYFSGMNLGNWLLWEGYLMMGDYNYRTHTQFFNSVKSAFGGDLNKAKEFEHQWRMNYLTQQGISDLKALGYNSVRVPFNYNMFWTGSAVKNDGFQYFDRVIEFCRNEGMYVLLDMHAAPGYQNPGDHSDNVNSNASQPRGTVTFWDGNNVNIASAVWKHIANRYKNEPVVWGYDLINEPVPQPGREFELMASMITMRDAVREVDNNHIIVAEGSWWGSDMQKLDWMDPETQNQSGINSRWDNNMVYQTHHYSTDLSQLDDRLAICNKLNVPMILGEYGESDNNNLKNMTDWCINNNVDYFPWSFKKMSHDKCLWTIHPNNAYNDLKAFINSGTPPSSSLYNDMIAFTQNNIANGSPGLTFDQGWYEATKPPCNLGAPANLSGGTPTPTQITLTWGDTASGESSYMIARNGATIATLSANSTSYTDSGLTGETCYTYTVTAVGSCPRGVSLSVCTPCGGSQAPYTGVAASVPGTIQAENYDTGCSGQAYFDTSDGNNGGAYRTDKVDISSTIDGGAGYNVGWVDAGEWLEYTVNVATSATYFVSYRVATPESTGQIQLKVNGSTLSTTNIPATGDWNVWATVDAGPINLTAGVKVIQIYFSGGDVNLNSFELSSGAPNLAPVANAGTNQNLPSGTTSATLNGSGSIDSDGGPSALTYAWTQTAGSSVNISNVSAVSPSITGLTNGNSYTFQLVVNDGEDNSAAANVSIAVGNNQSGYTMKIEAESYFEMYGLQTENTSDTGGGQNVGWIDGGDWAGYNVNIPSAGSYTISYRVASQNGGGQIKLEQFGGGTVFGTKNVAATGGWQNWTTISHTVQLNAGAQQLALSFPDGAFNLNWFEIKSTSGARIIDQSEELASAASISCYPNPTTNQLNITGLSAEYSRFTIYGLDGRQQYAQILEGQPQVTVDVSNLNKGVFILRLEGDAKAYKSIRFIKQ